MKQKVVALGLALLVVFAYSVPASYAVGAKEAAASLLLPTTGQAMNGQLGTTKSKVMAGVEVAGVTTLAILGGVVGGPVVWAAAGPLIANHVWSSVDAYKGAQTKVNNPLMQQQLMSAQNTLELSRQNRFQRQQYAQDDIRARLQAAQETIR